MLKISKRLCVVKRWRRIYEVNDRDSGPWPGQQVQTLKSFSLLHKNMWKSLKDFFLNGK